MSKLTSKVSYSKRGYNSMKTIIPQGIVQIMEIEHKDTLVWDIDKRDGEKVAVVRKKKG
jgi:hypothetical protein